MWNQNIEEKKQTQTGGTDDTVYVTDTNRAGISYQFGAPKFISVF